MNRVGKAIVIVIGLILLALLVFYFAPKISGTMNTQSTEQATETSHLEHSDGVKSFEIFLTDFNANTQYSFCAKKTVTNKDNVFELYFGCTIRENDYVIKTVQNEQELRQLYIDGEYTYINDTKKLVYVNIQDIDFPDTHFQQALSGKVIKAYGEIVDGYQANCVQLYKDGIVYAFYFNQQGELIRFYYIYDGNEIAIDFCGFFFGNNSDFASFMIPSTYKKGSWQAADNN